MSVITNPNLTKYLSYQICVTILNSPDWRSCDWMKYYFQFCLCLCLKVKILISVLTPKVMRSKVGCQNLTQFNNGRCQLQLFNSNAFQQIFKHRTANEMILKELYVSFNIGMIFHYKLLYCLQSCPFRNPREKKRYISYFHRRREKLKGESII